MVYCRITIDSHSVQISSLHQLLLVTHDLALLVPHHPILLLHIPLPLTMCQLLIEIQVSSLIIELALGLTHLFLAALLSISSDGQLKVDAFFVYLRFQLLDFLKLADFVRGENASGSGSFRL